jgi:tripartite-type tricarboxylate transporter receptor subunit TctC
MIRALCAAAAQQLGRPVLVEHRPGAAATLAARAMRDARPDGHTLAVMPNTVFRLPLLDPALAGFDPARDFTWITQLAGLLIGVVVRADAPWRSFRALLDHARANPDSIRYGIPGTNTTELPLEVIASEEGIAWTSVPFRAGPDSMQALLAGQIDAIADTSTWLPLVESGELRLLVTYDTARSARFPEVPVLREFGIDWPTDAPAGIAGPRGMAPEVVARLENSFRTALFDPSVQAMLARFAMPLRYLGSADYTREAAALYAQERAVLARLGRLPAQR